MSSRRTLAARALAVLTRNDTGRFFRPAPNVYPFQWNWDSALVALGLARCDAARGRREVRSLLEGRWADGMVPHIVFHPQPADYSPGPDLWRSESYEGAPAVATSALTQPPVLATAVRALHEADPDRAFLEEVVPEIDEWHRWFHRARSLDGSGLVSILHPWESADNSPRFDAALERVAVAGAGEVRRTDKALLDAAERPTDLEYRRYLALLAALDRVGYRPSGPAETPFAYLDLPLNSILCVAEEDLGLLWTELGDDGARAREAAAALRLALSRCWEEGAASYRERDLHGADAITETVADLFPLYAGVPDSTQARRLVDEWLWSAERFGPSAGAPWPVTTVSKSSPAFSPRAYWRGPVWINVNWFLIKGLARAGFEDEAGLLRASTLELVSRSGFSEYYEPSSGAPLGSRDFSWSAALTLDLLAEPT